MSVPGDKLKKLSLYLFFQNNGSQSFISSIFFFLSSSPTFFLPSSLHSLRLSFLHVVVILEK